MKIVDLLQNANYNELKEKDNNGRNIRLYEFSKLILTGLSNYYPDVLLKEIYKAHLVLPIKEMSMSLNKKSYYEEHGMEYDYTDKNEHNCILIETCVYFFIYNTENYYHFIYDTLPYLYCYLQLREENKSIKLLINYNKNKNYLLPFVRESLELLNITNDDIIIHKSNYIYDKMYLSNSLTHDGLSNQPPRKEIFEIYKKIVDNALSKSFNYKDLCHDKIYISRRTWINDKLSDNIGTNYTTRRKMLNEDNLVEMLERKGFIEIFGENYSMIEKILLFYKAKIIIGTIGSTITNCIFCCPNSKIITIVSPEFLNINYRMKFLFGNNVLLFNDTYLDCKDDEIAQNIRIEITDKSSDKYKYIGEIVNKFDNGYIIKLGKNYIGFNQDEDYDTIVLKNTQFRLLDSGINSPWKVDIHKLINL